MRSLEFIKTLIFEEHLIGAAEGTVGDLNKDIFNKLSNTIKKEFPRSITLKKPIKKIASAEEIKDAKNNNAITHVDLNPGIPMSSKKI